MNPTPIIHQQRRLRRRRARLIRHPIRQSDEPTVSLLRHRHGNILATTTTTTTGVVVSQLGVPRRLALESARGRRRVPAAAVVAVDGAEEDEVEDGAEAGETGFAIGV